MEKQSAIIGSPPAYTRINPGTPLLKISETENNTPHSCNYLFNFYYCVYSAFQRFFFESPKNWQSFLCHFEGWSVIFKSLIGTGINIWTFSHTGLPLPYAITTSVFTGIALFLFRGKTAVVNNAIYSSQSKLQNSKSCCSNISFLYYILKWNAAIGVGFIDYVSASVALINIFALLKDTPIEKFSDQTVIWSSIGLSIFIPYQFLKFRVALIDRGAEKFCDNLKRSPCSNRENAHSAITYFSFIFITIFNTVYFAMLNAFLGSSTLRKFFSLIGLPPFWRSRFNLTDNQFDMHTGMYAALSGVIVTLSNSSAELVPSKRRRKEICDSIQKRASVKLFLCISILDAIANTLLVFLVSDNSEAIKSLPARPVFAAIICLARMIPYVLQNFSKVINNLGKFKEAIEKVYGDSVALENNGHLLVSSRQINGLSSFESYYDTKKAKYIYPVSEELVKAIYKLAQSATQKAGVPEHKDSDPENGNRNSSMAAVI